ncbi:MAG: asparagine synthase (glutamine-hydrolyzing) [Candidatus Omnitrophica bacterium]|nr:asparagine synthase (glutamine-hydrolyzing) [Candidatus Omnitrophota bacterium]MDD5435939.1 asparagine synthase (glutamine-hydrolyzing) [Candidatus Omnitrophota bacterium]
MCGICGIISSRAGLATEEKVKAMAGSLVHRGPDDSGIYHDKASLPEAILGHRRLSIIDLSPRGHQPMSNEDGTVRMVLNGEIYNYRELKVGLEKKGHRFISNTDTETVIHLYEEYGEECVKYLRGMFAFAIWDTKKKKLLAARDRTGKKPFIYYHDGETLCFASEFASLLKSGIIKNDIDHGAISRYLTFGYIPAPSTVYRKVSKLPPAHILTFQNNRVAIRRYWKLDYSNKIKITEEDAAAEVLRLLKEAVKIRLYSDVPLGAFLSGGIDSSAVVGLMSELAGGRVKTFSIGFEEKAYNELAYARAIAKKFDTEHHEFVVKPEALSVLPLLVEKYGEPYADSSAIPTYYVCRETRRFVTVALNGDGGDESFAGYERYQAMLASDIYGRMPGPAKKCARFLMDALPDSADSKNSIRKIKRFFEGIDLPPASRYIRWMSIFNKKLKGELCDIKGDDPESLVSPYISDAGIGDLLDRLLAADVNLYLPDDLLVKVDIASMANSLEARSPFLDHKLMEFAAGLPAQYKMKNFVKKYILKKALKGLVPDKNLHRRKMGFGMPVGAWFRNELKGLMEETVFSASSFSSLYFKKDVVRKMVEDHVGKRRDLAPQLWALLMLELWYQRYVKGPS